MTGSAMGFLGELKSVYEKSEAAVVVQNLLEMQARMGLFDLDPGQYANDLVDSTWEARPDLFHGAFGQRPHKLAAAAAALAHGLGMFDPDDTNRQALALALGNVLSELEANGRLYPLNSLDQQLLEEAADRMAGETGGLAEDGLAEEGFDVEPGYDAMTWEAWFEAFKDEAGRVNGQLAVGDDGISLVDFMVLDPLKRAYSDGAGPRTLAREFAAQFDLDRFGIR